MAGDFSSHLRRFGPDANCPVPDLGAARRYCTALATEHYENFPVLTRFVPRALRPHFAGVYAYCRWSDDLADEVGDAAASLRLLNWWEGELDALYAGAARHPVFVALQPTVARFGIPRTPFADLLSAFRQDQHVTRYETYADLLDYCRRSADPVGRLVLYLCEAFDEHSAELSDRICTGLQLANFWQDVAIDLGKGRIYLPAEDRRRFGVTEEALLAGTEDRAFRDLMAFEVARAEQLFDAGEPLLRRLRGRTRVVVALFAAGGRRILERIRRADYRVLTARPRLTKLDGPAVFVSAFRRAALPLQQPSVSGAALPAAATARS